MGVMSSAINVHSRWLFNLENKTERMRQLYEDDVIMNNATFKQSVERTAQNEYTLEYPVFEMSSIGCMCVQTVYSYSYLLTYLLHGAESFLRS